MEHRALRAVLEQIGYLPQPQKLAALIIPDASNPFFTSLAFELGVAFRSHGWSMIASSSAEEPARELELVDEFVRVGVRAIAFCASRQLTSEAADYLGHLVLPLLQVDRQSADLDVPFIGIDNRAGAAKVVEHFFELGYSKVALMPGPSTVPTASARSAGFLEHAKIRGIAVEVLPETKLDFAAARSCVTSNLPLLMQQGVKGLFCSNDMQAIGAISAAVAMGVEVPSRLAVIGYDDIPAAQWISPQLTTISQPLGALARAVADRLVQATDAGFSHAGPKEQLLAPTLVVRAST